MVQLETSHKSSKLIAIFGDRGSGKSLLLVWFLLKSSIPFFCNFHIFNDEKTELSYEERKIHPRWHELAPEDLLNKNAPMNTQFKRKRVGITEAYEYFESRLGMGSFQRYMSYAVFQSRKWNEDLIIDTQLDDTIDHRFTRLCDYIIVAEIEDYGFHYYCSNKKVISEFSIPFKSAEKFWNKYDSWEVVSTPQIENLQTQISTLNRPRLKEKLNELEKRFFEDYKGIDIKKITHSTVSSFLLDIDETDIYESYLYDRLHKPKHN